LFSFIRRGTISSKYFFFKRAIFYATPLQLGAAGPTTTDFSFGFGTLRFHDFERNPGRGITRTAVNFHVGTMDGSLFADNPAFGISLCRPGVALHHVDTLDDQAVLVGKDMQYLGYLAATVAADDVYVVAFFNIHRASPLEYFRSQ
jgi:hypothetical protein